MGAADIHRREPTRVGPPGRPCPAVRLGQAKASYQHGEYGRSYRSFRGLIDHLATLTRNDARFAGTTATVPILAEPTADQREAFDLVAAAIPLSLK